ncbi:MAG TPA: ribbon-helix-helix domain-containing protein [Sphingomicrobium sp.]|nr:ribbon-helix-helix domain-containing protein [Sphingomicrobium sp.]
MPKSGAGSYKFTIGDALSRRLDELCRMNHVTRSAIIVDALRAWLNRKGDDELEVRFAARLDRMSRQLARVERNGHIELETLALFIRYMLTINAPLPEGDEAARAIGRDRFAAFIERVGRQLSTGRSTLVPEEGDE